MEVEAPVAEGLVVNGGALVTVAVARAAGVGVLGESLLGLADLTDQITEQPGVEVAGGLNGLVG